MKRSPAYRFGEFLAATVVLTIAGGLIVLIVVGVLQLTGVLS